MTDPIQQLLAQGVCMPAPATVSVDADVPLERIAGNATIHPGCRIAGAQTSIAPGAVLGEEAPVTLIDCQVGRNARLKGGFFQGATLLDGVEMGSCAHVRPGTLLEERVSCGHSVGLKQTILLPFVTSGSLINFCDCLMAGGTSGTNHSEIGSSYVHFNFTPHQDKATPSLVGDVPRGVMLDNPPIFLGGQGGLVGPTRITYGTVVAAGVICRHDLLQPDCLVLGGSPGARTVPYQQGIYGDISRVLLNNVLYIGNLYALLQWYRCVRCLTVHDEWGRACHAGALLRLEEAIEERTRRLTQLAAHLARSEDMARGRYGDALPETPFELHRRFREQWPALSARFGELGDPDGTAPERRDQFLEEFRGYARDRRYLECIRALSPAARRAGTDWLQAIVARGATLAEEPSGTCAEQTEEEANA